MRPNRRCPLCPWRGVLWRSFSHFAILKEGAATLSETAWLNACRKSGLWMHGTNSPPSLRCLYPWRQKQSRVLCQRRSSNFRARSTCLLSYWSQRSGENHRKAIAGCYISNCLYIYIYIYILSYGRELLACKISCGTYRTFPSRSIRCLGETKLKNQPNHCHACQVTHCPNPKSIEFLQKSRIFIEHDATKWQNSTLEISPHRSRLALILCSSGWLERLDDMMIHSTERKKTSYLWRVHLGGYFGQPCTANIGFRMINIEYRDKFLVGYTGHSTAGVAFQLPSAHLARLRQVA